MGKGGTSEQVLRRPNGGGAVNSIGSDFQINLNTGTGSYAVPIDLPDGYRSQSTQLALQYSSGAGHGEFGLGWSLGILAISRDSRRGIPHYSEADTFLLSGEILLPLGDSVFRPAVDSTFQRVRRLATGWEITDRQGTRYMLGTDPQSQERHPDIAGENGVHYWLLDRIIDSSGNETTFTYVADSGRRYLQRIGYAIFRVEIEYESRPDVYTSRRGGFARTTRWRGIRIAVHNTDLDPTLLRHYALTYHQDPLARHSLLASVTLKGFLFDPEEQTEQAPPIRFSYTDFAPQHRTLHSYTAMADAPPSLNSATVDLIDLDGFGLPGVIEANHVVHRYWPNRGGNRWGIPRKLKAFPQGASLADARVRFGDMNGDARADLLVSRGSLTGYYPGESGLAWGRMQRYSHNRPTFDARDRNVRWLDANGDGQVDAMVAEGGNFLLYEGKRAEGWEPLPRPIPRRRDEPTHPDVSFDDPRVRLVDMTGDGLIDIVRIFARHIEFWPSLGAGKWDERQVLVLPGQGPARFLPRQCFLADINGDGFTDVIYVDSDAIYVWVNQCGTAMAMAQIIRYPPVASAETVRTVDMLGTGTAGLLFGLSYRAGHREPYRFIDFTTGTKPYLLSRVDNGVGGVTEINYGSSTAHRQRDEDAGRDWHTFLPTAVQVVNSIYRTDTITGQAHTTTHRYHDGHYDADTRRFIGFGQVEVEESHGAETLTGLIRHYFHLGQAEDLPHLSVTHAAALRGLLYRKEVYGLDDTDQASKSYLVESTQWNVRVVATSEDGSEILFPHPQRREVDRYERTDEANILITELEHDDFGNVTLERRHSQPANSIDPIQVLEYHGTYINDENRWILGLPLRRTLVSDGERLDDTRFYYDDLPEGQSSTGLLTRRERLAFTTSLLNDVFVDTALPELTSLGYRERLGEDGKNEYWFDEYHVMHNPRGDIREHRDPMGEATVIEFDPEHGLYPVRVTNPAGHIYQASYHPRLGAITSMIDPNGNATSYIYTPLGRILQEVRPGDTEALPTVHYEYHTDTLPISTVMVRHRESGEAATRWSVSYYDGHGNVLETRSRLDDGNFQVGARERRDLRDLIVVRYPSFISPVATFDSVEGPAEPSMRFSYDPLQRVLQAVDAAGQIARAEFGPDTFTYFDTQDNYVASPFADTPRIQRVDPAGHVTATIEETGTGSQTTEYRYDAADHMTEVVDASGTVLLQQTFDFAGRKTRIDHRDAGMRRFLHDARGKLALYVDPQDRRIGYRFDNIGRQIGIDFDETEVEQFTYDAGTGTHLVGRLAEATDALGSHSFSYDSRGRVAESIRVVTGHSVPFTYDFTYDPDDRRRQVTYPDGSVATYSYDAIGRLSAITGLIDQIDYDARGRRERVVYASGLETSFQYEAALGRLHEHALLNPATGEELFHQRFNYDSAGNVTAIDDLRSPGPGATPVSRSFEYDALSRLTRVQGGPASDPYDHHFEFDDIGNMTLNESARSEPLWHEGARLRGYEGPGGPQSIYEYDANGCMRTRPGMVLEFDRRDMLELVVREDAMEVEFAYDYAARRLRKRVRSGVTIQDTIYIGESFEVRPDGTRIRYISDPEGAATLVVRQGADTQVLHHDYLGNTIVVRNTNTGQAREVYYLPYGETRNPGGDVGEVLFAAKRLDPETGLYYFRMRYYDPSIGRFISPDPVAVATPERGRLRPLSLNPYVYALDNPQRYTDPNGLWSFWEAFLTIVVVIAVVVVTALTFGVAGVVALGVGAAVGAIIGGVTTGSLDGALAGAMLGFGVVATALFATALFGPLVGYTLAGIQALGFIPGVRQNETYKDILGYSSWLNPWSWPGHIVGGVIFIVNAIVYGVAYAVTWGDPPDWADMSVSFEQGMVVTEGGLIRPGRAFNFGAFTNLNPDDAGVSDPATREVILRHERGHSLNNAYFGVLQIGRIGASSQDDSFWEQMAESNVNPNVPGLTGDKDERRRNGGRGFGDIPWWNP